MSGFTPGPWSIGPSHVVALRCPVELPIGTGRYTQFIAECCNTHGHEGETEANARLIAAAPELYAATAAFVAAGNLSIFSKEADAAMAKAFDLAEMALRKARGGEQ